MGPGESAATYRTTVGVTGLVLSQLAALRRAWSAEGDEDLSMNDVIQRLIDRNAKADLP